MNLNTLSKQHKDKSSNYYFIRLSLVTNYLVGTLNLFDFYQVLENKDLSRNEKVFFTSNNKITLKAEYQDLQHAKHDAFSILDRLENEFKSAFNLKYLIGSSDGKYKLFLKDKDFLQFISFNFKKMGNRVVLEGIINLSYNVLSLIEKTNINFNFSPYVISLFPIQLNNKELVNFGKQIEQKLIKFRHIHDQSEISHMLKTKLSTKLKIPFLVTYGIKDILEKTINITSTEDNKFYKVKLNDLKMFTFTKTLEPSNFNLKPTYLCESKKCRESIRLSKNLLMLKTFDQNVFNQKCQICSKQSTNRFVLIKVGE